MASINNGARNHLCDLGRIVWVGDFGTSEGCQSIAQHGACLLHGHPFVACDKLHDFVAVKPELVLRCTRPGLPGRVDEKIAQVLCPLLPDTGIECAWPIHKHARVRSGFGHVQRGARTVDKLEDEHLPGTVVGLRIKTDRPFDFTLAWNQLTDALNNVPSLLDQLRHADN